MLALALAQVKRKMENPVRKLRKALGISSQEKLARILGMSSGSVRRYEDGAPIPDRIVEKLKDLAAKQGLPSTAISFSLEIRHQNAPLRAVLIEDGSAEKPAHFPERTAHWHILLEYVLTGGVEIAIEAVTKNLVAFQLVTALVQGDARGTTEGDATIPPDIASRIAELRGLAEQPQGSPAVLRPKKRRTS